MRSKPRLSLMFVGFFALVLALAGAPGVHARELTLVERVSAQEAIERVYYAHQIGATAPFEEAVPRSLLERKVLGYLAKTAALESRWNTPVTAAMLERELARIARNTRSPDRLRELFAALDDDPVLVTECLVRPVLVDRLVRQRFEEDQRILAESSWDGWWSEAESDYHFATTTFQSAAVLTLPDVSGTERGDAGCGGNAWEQGLLSSTPEPRQGHTAVWTGTHMLVWGGSGMGGFPPSGLRYDPSTDVWSPISSVGEPEARSSHSAVWTGDTMVIWGGVLGQPPGPPILLQTGGRYNPTTDTWSPTSLVSAPAGRWEPSAVWTGSHAIFWGGYGASDAVATGGLYDPVADTWTPTSMSGAPSARSEHSAVWTGSRMVVWGGLGTSGFVNSGGRYDPVTNTWTTTSTAGAPIARYEHTAVWSGSRMIVWGGIGNGQTQNTGGRYDPSTNTWSATSVTGAPASRSRHTALWSGTHMLVWGGDPAGVGVSNDGARYDPTSNSWSPITTSGAPAGRVEHSAVWTGSEMVVWGGHPNFANGYYEVFDSGGRYDPNADTWAPTFVSGAPLGRASHTAVWTGNLWIVWGGGLTQSKTLQVNPTGARYDPATDSWSPTTTIGAPVGRIRHSAVWTGVQMIVWGGWNNADFELAVGGRYDPVADTWSPTATSGAPSHRERHTAVWTGSEMVVWGGEPLQQTGGRYHPGSDTWTPTSVVNAPAPRLWHTAVWTGSRMLVWGGYASGGLASGSAYDPLANQWQPLPTLGAPSARYEHTAVWTGTEMIVWGGSPSSVSSFGGRYRPQSDSWLPTSLEDAPTPRSRHTAVWTGNRMVIWGGSPVDHSVGASYGPAADTWMEVPTSGEPQSRADHTAAWIGDRMLVWGGNGIEAPSLADGGSYIPEGPDGDGDGSSCTFDCDDADPGAFAIPSDVQGLVAKTKTVMLWSAVFAGTATSYDVLRGTALPVGDPSEVCLAPDYLPANPNAGSVDWLDEAVPEPGAAYWYLVRASNACGVGSYGTTSAGEERSSVTCP